MGACKCFFVFLLSVSWTTARAAGGRPSLLAAPCHTHSSHYTVLEPWQRVSWAGAPTGGPIKLAAHPELCLTAVDKDVVFAPCNTTAAAAGRTDPSQDWDYREGTPVLRGGGGLGLQNGGLANARVWIGKGAGRQHINFNATTSVLDVSVRGGFNDLVQKNLCVTWSTPVRPCDPPSPAASFPMCNLTAPVATRVADLVSRLPPATVPHLLVNMAPAVDSLWLQPQNWWSEALHGVQSGCANTAQGSRCPVSFPAAISTAASFNKTLFEAVGNVVGTEARALSNIGVADGFTFWTPNINIYRDPRWGRGQETPGEDPTLNAAYAAFFIRGFQAQPNHSVSMPAATGTTADTRLRASACAKHYFAYNLENCYTYGDNCRMNFDAVIPQRDIEDTFLPAFQAAVEQGRVSGLMCSYNSMGGVPACADAWSMTTVARGSWAFDGSITSDCGAVSDVSAPRPRTHPWDKRTHGGHGYRFPPGGSMAGAGLDSNCNLGGGSIGGSEQEQVAALSHLYAVQMRLGIFDPLDSNPWSTLGATDVASPPHQETALDAARQSMVLLTNKDSRLPLRPAMAVALIGPCLEVSKGGYSQGGSQGPHTLAARAAIEQRAAKVTAVVGCADPKEGKGSSPVHCAYSDAGWAAARQAAAEADVVVVALGIDGSFEGENGDYRAFSGIGLPGAQAQLLANVTKVAKQPVVVVVSGSSVDLAGLKENPKVGAILWSGYAGEAAGLALAEVLYGEHNPSGRLTSTFYPSSFIDEWLPGVDPYTGGSASSRNASFFDVSMRPNATTGNPGRTHRFYTGSATFRFGDGISYTQFEHQLLTPPRLLVDASAVQRYASWASDHHVYHRRTRRAAAGGALHTVRMRVRNVGRRDGAHSVLVFAVPPSGIAGVDGVPLRELVWFDKVHVSVGGAQDIAFELSEHDLTAVAPGGGRTVIRGEWTFHVGDERVVVSVE